MIGSAGSMMGSGGAFASHASRGGKIRPKAVLVCDMLMNTPPFLPRDYRMTARAAQDAGQCADGAAVSAGGAGGAGVLGGRNGCVGPCGGGVPASCGWAAPTCRVRSRMQRANVSLIAAEPVSDSVQGGS